MCVCVCVCVRVCVCVISKIHIMCKNRQRLRICEFVCIYL